MTVHSSVKRFFVKIDGGREFIGREVDYEVGGQRKNVFISSAELGEEIAYSDLTNYLEV